MTEKLLIIKHGAFGDFIQSVGALRAIRGKHVGAHITMLTTKQWVTLCEQMSLFDAVHIDPRGGLKTSWQTVQWIKHQQFDFVYDLQNTDRTAWYFRLLRPKPTWCGAVWGATYRHNTPDRCTIHTLDRLQQQLSLVGLNNLPPPDVDWLADTDIAIPDTPFALIVPGGAPHREAKRWTVQGYSDLCEYLLDHDITPVLLGTKADANQTAPIAERHSRVINLTDQTNFADIATLARRASLAVGNDTGPMHLIAVAGTRTLTLYSHDSDPARCGQRGADSTYIRVPDLQKLPVEDVVAALGSKSLTRNPHDS